MTDRKTPIVLFFVVVALTSLVCIVLYLTDNKYHTPGLQAMDGLLIVEEGDLVQHPIRYLVTGWAFYPDVLLTPQDFKPALPDRYQYFTSIGEQVRFSSTGDKNNPHGSGSYYLKLSLPDTLQTYALDLPEIFSAYTLYVGDRLMLTLGDPQPESYQPRTQNRMITFEASGQTTLLLAVSDYSHFYSGMVYPPAFGTPLALNTTRGLRLGIALFVAAIALLAGVLSLYFGLRMQHKNAKLFSLLCLVMGVFTSYSLTHSALALPIFPWYGLEMLSGYLLTLLVIVLHNRICGMGFIARRCSVAAAAAMCLLALGYGLCSASLSVPVMQAFSWLLFVFKAATAAYLLCTAFLSITNNNRQAAPLFYASVVYATTFVWDRIFPQFEPIFSGWFIEWGSLALICTIGYTLWRDITTAYHSSLTFAQERRLMTRQLAMQAEYARQLQKSNDENRRLTHDFRHQLHTLKGMALHYGKDNELLRYLSEQDRFASTPSYTGHFCDNVAVNALLQYYNSMAAENGVQAEFQLLLPPQIPLTDVELCTVLGNLLENGTEACLRQTHGKRYVHIFTKVVGKTFYLVVENSTDGTYRMEGGRLLSHKQKELRFGIGLESVRHTVEQHGGALDVFPEPVKFRVGITLPLQQENSAVVN